MLNVNWCFILNLTKRTKDRNMKCTIEFTLPLVAEGEIFAECEVAVDITVTYMGKDTTYASPAEGPEWNVGAYYVDIGRWDRDIKKMHHKLVPAPTDIITRMDAYLETTEGRDTIISGIEDEKYKEAM